MNTGIDLGPLDLSLDLIAASKEVKIQVLVQLSQYY